MSSAGSGNRQMLAADDDTVEKEFVGPLRLSLSGTFGGGTAKLQAKDPNGAFVDVANGSFTDVADKVFDFPADSLNIVRINMAGSTSPALRRGIAFCFYGRRGPSLPEAPTST